MANTRSQVKLYNVLTTPISNHRFTIPTNKLNQSSDRLVIIQKCKVSRLERGKKKVSWNGTNYPALIQDLCLFKIQKWLFISISSYTLRLFKTYLRSLRLFKPCSAIFVFMVFVFTTFTENKWRRPWHWDSICLYDTMCECLHKSWDDSLMVFI